MDPRPLSEEMQVRGLLADLCNTLELHARASTRLITGKSLATNMTLRLWRHRMQAQEFSFETWRRYNQHSWLRRLLYEDNQKGIGPTGIDIRRLTDLVERQLKKPKIVRQTLAEYDDPTSSDADEYNPAPRDAPGHAPRRQ